MRSPSDVGLVIPFLAALSQALLGALPSGASQETTPLPALSVETSLVTLPVTVVDRHGAFVPGLTRTAFTVFDNGTPQAITVFRNDDVPATVGLVIDSSGSMQRRREDVTAAAGAFAELSHPLDELFTMNFNEAVWPGLPWRLTFAENLDQLRTALARAPARGMTALYDAVDRALDRLELGTHDRKALIVVSDGGDNASVRTLEEVLVHARRANATIYGVVVTDPDNRDAKPGVLKKLAQATGGDVLNPKRADDVTEAFARIARELRAGYTIGFTPPRAPDGGFRSIRVVVDGGKERQLKARTRVGYYAGPSARRSG